MFAGNCDFGIEAEGFASPSDAEAERVIAAPPPTTVDKATASSRRKLGLQREVDTLSLLPKCLVPQRGRVFVVIAGKAAPPGDRCLQWSTSESWLSTHQ